MALNILFLIALVGLMLIIQSWKALPGADFVAAYNPIIWAVISATAGCGYAVFTRNRGSLIHGLWQILLIVVIANFVSLALYGWLHPQENVLIAAQANLYFFLAPSIVIVLICYTVVGSLNK